MIEIWCHSEAGTDEYLRALNPLSWLFVSIHQLSSQLQKRLFPIFYISDISSSHNSLDRQIFTSLSRC
jgi:hypothetical protein